MLKRLKKFIARTILFLSILAVAGYTFIVWQAKQGIDAFALSYPLQGQLEYEWLLADLDGNLFLYDVSLYQKSKEPVFQASRIEIKSVDFLQLSSLREKVIYQSFPDKIVVNLVGGTSSQLPEMAAIFGIAYQPQMLSYLYPKSCNQVLVKDLPTIKFDMFTEFSIQQTADISSVKFGFDSKEFAQIEGSFDINNFTRGDDDGGFITGLSVQLHELYWLQQNTQKCLAEINVSLSEFEASLKPQMKSLAKSYGLLLSEQAASYISDFVFVPQTVGVDFSIKQGKTFSQIPLSPFYDYQDLTGLSVKLNLQPLGSLFNEYVTPVDTASTAGNGSIAVVSKPVKKSVYLKINRQSLSSQLGAKLKLRLKNNIEVIGYLESVNGGGIKLRQLKFKGESILPFAFSEIKSILRIRKD